MKLSLPQAIVIAALTLLVGFLSYEHIDTPQGAAKLAFTLAAGLYLALSTGHEPQEPSAGPTAGGAP